MGQSEGSEVSKEIVPPVLALRTVFVVRVGLVLWTVALVVLWSVPALSAGDRSWWPWVPVAGLVVGILGYTYVVRGAGNASEA